ncbi:hypothetical protein Btru_044786 [Bulinus truncatus]|nr:hypothetical protein Btru_044786 [Bulinus truncatus]
MHNKNFDFTDKHHAHHECIVRENNTKSCLKKIPVPTSSCHKCEMSSKNCDTFTVIGSRKSCSSPQLGFGTITNCAAPEKCKCLLAAESNQASTKKPDCFIQNKNSSQTVPEMCCCQNKSNRNNSHGCAMFPSTYINRFCPNNPSRIDSDATEPTSNEWSISFESFKEHLKTFRPNRNKVNPPKQPTNLIDTYHHPNPGTVFIPEFDFEQKLSKSRKISSSKSSFKISSSLNRNRLLKSSSLPGNITFNPLRASTPFGELSESDSSFSHKTLSTIREPSCSKDSTTAEDTTLNQTTYSDGSDDVDLLV